MCKDRIKLNGKKIISKLVFISLLSTLLIPSFAYGATTPTFTRLAEKQVYSKTDVRWVIGKAAAYYKLSSADTVWLKNAAVDIIFTGVHPNIPDKYERRESGGGTHAGAGRICQGIVQFDRGWAYTAKSKQIINKYEPWHKNSWRMSGIASLYRITKVMKDGGRPAIQRHWKATLGR